MTREKTVYIGRRTPLQMVARVLGDPNQGDVLIGIVDPLGGNAMLSVDPVDALALADSIRRAALEVLA